MENTKPTDPFVANRLDPYMAFNFLVVVDGLPMAGFKEVSGLHVNIENIPYHEGGGGSTVHQLAGRAGFGSITLSKGLSVSNASGELWNWVISAAEGEIKRRQVSIILRKTIPGTKETVWDFSNAWPKEWQGGMLDAMSSAVVIETFTLVFQSIARESRDVQ